MSDPLAAFRLWERLRTRLFTMVCRASFASLGDGSSIVPPARIYGEGRIVLRDRVYVGSHSWLQVLKSPTASNHPTIEIGSGTSIAGFCTISAVERVVIEDSVLMARYVYIADHRHEFSRRDQPVVAQGIAGIAPVRICQGAWLGQNVVVCPGVTIGRNAVIGANSVVRHDVPDFMVAAGAPAKMIRRVDATKDRSSE